MNIGKVIGYMDQEIADKSIQCKHIAELIEDDFGYENNFFSDACAVCDVGMVFVSPDIRNKPEPLLDSEKEVLDMHSYFGYKLLKDFGLDELSLVVAAHHPKKPSLHLLGEEVVNSFSEEIKVTAKRVYTVDVFVALITEKSYRPAFSSSEAIEYMYEHTEEFDEEVLYCIVKQINKGEI